MGKGTVMILDMTLFPVSISRGRSTKDNNGVRHCLRTGVVTGLLTGNTLKVNFYIIGMLYSPLCTKCDAKEETSAHVLCEPKDVVSLRRTYWGSFFLDTEDVRSK
jgi:hypothetical protein